MTIVRSLTWSKTDPAEVLCAAWTSLLEGPLVHQVITRVISTEYNGSNWAAIKAVKDAIWNTIVRSGNLALMDTLVDALATAVVNHDRLLTPFREITLFSMARRYMRRHGAHTQKAKTAVQLMAYSLNALDCDGMLHDAEIDLDQWLRLLLDKAGPTPCTPLANLAYRHRQRIQSWDGQVRMWSLAVFQLCHLSDPQVLADESVRTCLPKVLTTPRTANVFQVLYDKAVMGIIPWKTLSTIVASVAESEPAAFGTFITSVNTISDVLADEYLDIIDKATRPSSH